jgi:alpha-ketoglutarate-dependent taurine dioxygenase
MLSGLQAHATQEEFKYVHQWRPGDILMWDNRCLLHKAMQNYEMRQHRRVLRRTTVKGTAPI